MLTTNNTAGILAGVMEVIAGAGKITGPISPDQDIYDGGVTSLMALPILLELEDRFQVSIPDDLFITARTSQAMADLIAGLRQE